MKNQFPIYLIAILLGGLLFLSSCEKDPDTTPDPDPDPNPTNSDYSLGWTGEDNLDQVPTSTNFGFGNGTLPASVDLIPKFPPIGDQGQYGTCVSWAVGYNIKTAISGINKGLTTSQLSSAANQYSPKDLFIAIPDNQKGPDCNGTNFSEALTVMQNRGVATMQTVPYTNLGNCSNANLQPGWTSEANQNRIQYWRKIDPSITSIKQNLANNIPVILGARLADNFMSWNSDQVLSSATSYNNVGQHAYHAMVIAGYDDNKGPNGAFRVINSWGNFWGDVGYIWVDYNFMMNEFCTSPNGDKPLFIAADEEGGTPPPDDPTPTSSGVDLAPWVFYDYSTLNPSYPNERIADMNIYNIGTQAATPDKNWANYYIYFNAYDANDYGILFYDEFNTSIPTNTFDCPTSENCVFNVEIPSGSSFAEFGWGYGSIERYYYMPPITGYYFLLMITDLDDKFVEADELNNLFYTTINPVYFQDGFGFSPNEDEKSTDANGNFKFENEVPRTKTNLKSSPFNSIVTKDFPNAYTQAEITDFLQRENRNGNLQKKIAEYLQRGENTVNLPQ